MSVVEAAQGPRVPSLADIEKIAEASIPVIERDSAQQMNERMRKVVKHWLIRAMAEVRTATLAQHKAELQAVMDRISNEMSLLR